MYPRSSELTDSVNTPNVTSSSFWDREVYRASPLSDLERVDSDAIFDWLASSLPATGSKIDWSRTPGRHSHQQFADDTQLEAATTREVLRRTSAGQRVDHAGDGLSPVGVRFGHEAAVDAVAALLQIPEHHYFVDESRSWLVVVTIEGDLDVLDQLD